MYRIMFAIMCCPFIMTVKADSKFTSIERFLRQKISTKNFQKYKDKVTNAHELTHILHGELRQKFCKAGQNCFMLPDNSVYIIQEPKILKSLVAQYVPTSFQGKHFDHYVLKSRDWEKYPSYLIDEWLAYFRGAQAGLEVSSELSSNRDVFSGLVELAIYSNAIIDAMSREDPKFYSSRRGQNYHRLILTMNDYTTTLASKILKKPNLYFKEDHQLFNDFMSLSQKKTSLLRGSKTSRL